jgi:hypothetical protein
MNTSNCILLSFTVTFVLAVSFQDKPASRTLDYAGYYQLTRHKTPFHDFHQFELRASAKTNGSSSLEGVVVFFTDTLRSLVDTTAYCPMKYISLKRDSLIFSTQDCFSERYELQGRFIVTQPPFETDPNLVVLRGLLSRFVENALAERAEVSFIYTAGD